METQTTSHKTPDGKLSKGLGVFSFGLGAAQLAAPRAIARLIGVEPRAATRLTLRLLGAREVAAGIGIFARPHSPLPLWSRVVGDAMDVGLLLFAMRGARRRNRLAVALGSVAGVALLDVIASIRKQRAHGREPVVRTITINRPAAEVYAQWRTLEQQPRWMKHVERVIEPHGEPSQWIGRLPGGVKLEWKAEITEDIPGQRISWRSTGRIPLRGTVQFSEAPGGRGTEVRWSMTAAGALGKLFLGPEMASGLRRFKQLLETGEIIESDASIHKGPHPAQPTGEVQR